MQKTNRKQYNYRKKIIIITNHSYMLYQFRRELIQTLMTEHEVILCMPFVGHEEDFRKMGLRCINIEVDRRGLNPKTDLKLYYTYKKLLRAEAPDMVITYSIKPNIYAGYACRRLKIPYCVNVQGLGTAFQREPAATAVAMMYRAALRNAKTVFFENADNAAEFVRRGVIPANKEKILKGAGVNLEVYRQQPYPDESGGIHFLFLGRIMKEKGVDELFAAAKRLKKKYGERIVFDLVGFFEDEYKDTVERLDADGIIKFHGFQTNPKPFYMNSHCVVLPSYHEGMSNVLLEAAATGRALIASDIPGGGADTVEEGVNGFLCRKKDAEDLERCVERFMRLSGDQRETMGKRGRRKMELEFDKFDVVGETVRAIGG